MYVCAHVTDALVIFGGSCFHQMVAFMTNLLVPQLRITQLHWIVSKMPARFGLGVASLSVLEKEELFDQLGSPGLAPGNNGMACWTPQGQHWTTSLLTERELSKDCWKQANYDLYSFLLWIWSWQLVYDYWGSLHFIKLRQRF